jgi:meso-butanediol dehydrogenase/(S,S)-butanediol dehydrogenase/diacetyl reductase
LITGAAGGIGSACARRLAAEGARLLLVDLDGDGVERLAASLGPGHLPMRADVTQGADVRRIVDAAYARWGRLDVLFNNAGVIQGKPLLEITEADWDRILTVNLRAAFFVMQEVARRMIHQEPIAGSELRGKLIQMASVAAYRGGFPIMGHYAASKAGVISITRTAAQALAPHKVTSNAVCPGAVDTAMWAQLDADWTASEGWERGEAWRRRTAMVPLGRPQIAGDVAGVVAFLAGPDSDFITGQAINVDGGVILGN